MPHYVRTPYRPSDNRASVGRATPCASMIQSTFMYDSASWSATRRFERLWATFDHGLVAAPIIIHRGGYPYQPMTNASMRVSFVNVLRGGSKQLILGSSRLRRTTPALWRRHIGLPLCMLTDMRRGSRDASPGMERDAFIWGIVKEVHVGVSVDE